jgi:histidyl-tRNA synthetase
MGIPYVIIIGENELNLDKVKIKDMNNGIDKEVSFYELKKEASNFL